MVFGRILSVLGRTSYGPATHGLFTLLRNYRSTSSIALRYRRSQLPTSSSRYYPLNRGSHRATIPSTSKATTTSSRLARQCLQCQTKSSSPIRTGTRCDNTRFRLPTWRLSTYPKHSDRKSAQPKNVSKIFRTLYRSLTKSGRCLHHLRTRWFHLRPTNRSFPSHPILCPKQDRHTSSRATNRHLRSPTSTVRRR